MPSLKKPPQPQDNFSGSKKKEYYIEGLVVFYRNEIRIKHMINECWHVIHNQHVTHYIKSTL